MRICCILLLFLLTTSVLLATSVGTVRGKVIDKATGKPIVGANVFVVLDKKGTKLGVTSQTDGTFVLANLPEGTWTISCEQTFYVTQRIIGVAIKEDHTFLAYFKMTEGDPKKTPPQEILTYAALQAQLNAKTKVATQTETSIFDAPATVYVISNKQIQERGYMTLDEVLEDIPEIVVHMRADPQYGDVIGLRGLYGNEKFLILQNGVRISSLCSNPLPLEKNYHVQSAEKIEILIGPASALYGTDAFLGVINIITQTGNQVNGGSVYGSYGMFNTTNNGFAVGYGNKKISVAANGGVYASQEAYLPKYYSKDFDWYLNRYIPYGQMRADANDTSLITTLSQRETWATPRIGYSYNVRLNMKNFEIGHSRTEQSISSSWGMMPSISIYGKSEKWQQSNTNVYLQHTLAPDSAKWQLKSLLNLSAGVVNRNSNFVNAFSSYNPAYKYANDYNAQLIETFSYQINDKHQFTLGTNLTYTNAIPITSDLTEKYGSQPIHYYSGTEVRDSLGNLVLDVNGNPAAVPQLYFNTQRFVGGIFGQYQARFSNKFFMLLGFRGDVWATSFKTTNEGDYQKDSKAAFTPRLGLVYRPIPELGFKLFYGESFSLPSPNDAFLHYGSATPNYDSTGAISGFESYFFRLPNFKLLAQRSRTIETSTIFAKGNFVATVGAYFNIANNLYRATDQTTGTDSLGSIHIGYVERYQATGREAALGVNVKVDYRIAFGKGSEGEFRFTAAWSWAKGWETNTTENIFANEQLQYIPAHNVKAGILFRYKGFSFDTRLLFRSSMYSGDHANVAPAAFVINATARYVVLDPAQKKYGLSFFVKARNLTAQPYYMLSSNNPGYFGVTPQDPIGVLGGASFTF